MKKNIYKLLVCLFLSIHVNVTQVFSQIELGGGGLGGGGGSPKLSIFGDNTVNAGDNRYYTVTFTNVTPYAGNWTALGGTITSQTMNNVDVTWNSDPGTLVYNLTSSSAGSMSKQYAVSVATLGPATPNNPTISSLNCINATLLRDTPTSGVTWYWQGINPNGTSTINSSTTYTVTNSGTYYLRARNINGEWSSNSGSVSVSIGSIGATVWYQDTDGDGLGDPSISITSCMQPLGYVSNGNDQCVSSSNNTSNGCPSTQTLSDENYVYTIIPQIEVTDVNQLILNKHSLKNVTYFDGLGRTKQSIAIKQSATEKDIIIHSSYDALGRQVKEYLPYAANNAGGYMRNETAVVSEISNYYNTHYASDMNPFTPNPYSEKTLESSPLNRVLEQAAPGDDWRKTTNILSKGYSNGHTIKMEYHSNQSSDDVKYYTVNFISTANNTYAPSLTLATSNNGEYLQGELSKVITKDENWITTDGLNHTTEEFTNQRGQLILKRNYNEGARHDTYYVYDNFGNLTYVLTPKSLATIDKPLATELDNLCYQYKYDHRNRLVEKKIPEKGWESIVYDKLDRPIMTQDALQGGLNKWLFTKYDVLGRVTYTGEFTDAKSRITMQSHVNATNNLPTELYESKSNAAGSLSIHYTNNNFPNSGLTIFSVNYYDNYTFDRAGSSLPNNITYAYGGSLTLKTKGLPTGSKIRVLGESDWITSVNYYDKMKRSVYVYSRNNFLNTTDIVQSKLDFAGKVEETTANHTNDDDLTLGTQTITDKFTYDHAARLATHKQSINAGTEEMIAENTYDELGQLKTKGVGHTASSISRLQKVDFTYNVRGWLKHINQDTNSDNDLFNFTLRYNNPTSGDALYNGNISQTSWKTLNTDASTKTYTYSYDALNRITRGLFTSTNTDQNNEYNLKLVEYDKNGNISKLHRNGHKVSGGFDENLDHMTYVYDTGINRGNKLIGILEEGNHYEGFADKTNIQNVDYYYDINGNMTRDLNKNIGTPSSDGILYNHLNLPIEVKFENNNNKKINYTYDASGMKLRKVVNNNGNKTITNYANGFVYDDNSMEYFTTSEGYYNITGNSSGNITGDYVFQYKDHLGNVRLSYTDRNNDGDVDVTTDPNNNELIEEDNYYPFGLRHKGYNDSHIGGNDLAQKRKFGGMELQDDNINGNQLNWYDITARNYDAALGRWMNIDPLAEQMRRHSPYNYAFNNPIFFLDPDGMAPKGAYGESLENTSSTWWSSNQEDWDYSVDGESVSYESIQSGDCCNGFDKALADLYKFNSQQLEDKTFQNDLNNITNTKEFSRGKNVLGIGSIIYGLGELLIHNEKWGYWLDSKGSFKSYSLLEIQSNGKFVRGVQGYRYGLEYAKRYASKWKVAGKFAFGFGVVLSATEGVNHLYNGNYEGATMSAIDIAMGRVGFLGPWGAGISATYFGFQYLTNNGYIRTLKDYKSPTGGGCFIGTTKIEMADNTIKNISKIVVGDKIKTYNFVKNKVEDKNVLEIYSGVRKNLIEITFSDNSVNINTDTHPYYTKGKGWSSFNKSQSSSIYNLEVNQLKIGDIVYKHEKSELKELKILEIKIIDRKMKIYNISNVVDNHNFFANGVLVHNKRKNN